MIFPVKTECSRLVSILLYDIFSQKNNNTLPAEIPYFARAFLLGRILVMPTGITRCIGITTAHTCEEVREKMLAKFPR